MSRTLLEKQSQTILVNGKDYLVTPTFIDATRTKIIVNSEVTNLLNVGDSYTLSDGATIGITGITYQDFAGGIHSIGFYLASKISNTLDLSKLTLNKTTNGSSAVAIRGLILTNSTKTIFLEKINATVKSVCIKDADAGFDSISSTCDSTNETLVTCDNNTNGQYACYDTGSRYKITGLSHSAVKEQCRDNDGDGFGEGCAAGIDNCDTDSSTSSSCPSGGGGNSGGGSSGGGGGGGGGSGGGLTFVCNMDWECGEWTDCINGLQTRQCDFVKVPQHAQETECPSSSSPLVPTQKCEAPKQLALAAETCNDNIKNQDEQEVDCGGACNPCKEKNLTAAASDSEKETNQLTGFSVKGIAGKGSIAAAFIVAIFVVFIAIKFYRRKQQ